MSKRIVNVGHLTGLPWLDIASHGAAAYGNPPDLRALNSS